MSLHGKRINFAWAQSSNAGLEVDLAKIDVVSKLPLPCENIEFLLLCVGLFRWTLVQTRNLGNLKIRVPTTGLNDEIEMYCLYGSRSTEMDSLICKLGYDD